MALDHGASAGPGPTGGDCRHHRTFEGVHGRWVPSLWDGSGWLPILLGRSAMDRHVRRHAQTWVTFVYGPFHAALKMWLTGKLTIIAPIARWQSPAVLRYAAEAPLASISDSYRTKLQCFNYKKFLNQVRLQNDRAKEELSKVQDLQKKDIMDEVKRMVSQVAASLSLQPLQPFPIGDIATEEAIDDTPSECQSKYISNMTSKVIHKPLVWSTSINSHEWTSRCGWAFGKLGRYFPETEIPPEISYKLICTTCLPHERQARRDAQGGEEEDVVSTRSSSSEADSSDIADGTEER